MQYVCNVGQNVCPGPASQLALRNSLTTHSEGKGVIYHGSPRMGGILDDGSKRPPQGTTQRLRRSRDGNGGYGEDARACP